MIFRTVRDVSMLISQLSISQLEINMATLGLFSEMYIKFKFLALYLRFETCLEYVIGQVCSYLRHKHKLLKLSRLSDF